MVLTIEKTMWAVQIAILVAPGLAWTGIIPKVLANNCAYQWLRRCMVPANPGEPSICDLGTAFPPWVPSSWSKVLNKYVQCTELVYGAGFAEIRVDTEACQAAFTWVPKELPVPATLGICYLHDFCSLSEVRGLLVPLLLFTHARPQANGIQLRADLFQLDDLADRFLEHPDLHADFLEVAEQSNVLPQIHARAMQEALRLLPHSARLKTVSGVLCIVGQPRTLHQPEVYKSLRSNLIDALNFTAWLAIFVLDFGHNEKSAVKNPKLTIADLAEVFEAIFPSVLVTTAAKREGPNPNGTCAPRWSLGCNAQFKDLEQCWRQVGLQERQRGARFDWVVRVRPDIRLTYPLGNIRTYDANMVHAKFPLYTGVVWDGFALIPRRYADAYFSARQYGGTEYCWLHSPPSKGVADCELRLTLHLHDKNVPVSRTFPYPLLEVVRPTGYDSKSDFVTLAGKSSRPDFDMDGAQQPHQRPGARDGVGDHQFRWH